MNSYVNSNPWQQPEILKAHALNYIQHGDTIQVIVAAVVSELNLSSRISGRIKQFNPTELNFWFLVFVSQFYMHLRKCAPVEFSCCLYIKNSRGNIKF